MKYYFGKNNFDIESKDIDEAACWLNSLGLNHNKNRVGRYTRDIKLLANAFINNKLNELINETNFNRLCNSLFEATELSIIYKGLKNIKDDNFLEKLRMFIKGPIYRLDEKLSSGSHTARDIGFELNIASHFAATKFNLDFTTNADLLIHDDQRYLFIECKRPSSLKNIDKCIHDAHKQLTRRFNRFNLPDKTYGIVVLSLSKLMNRGDMFLEVLEEQQLEKELSRIITNFIKTYEKLWAKELDIRRIGIILYINTPAILTKYNIFVCSEQFGAIPVGLKGDPRYHYFLDVCKRLSPSIQLLHT